jgi:hypothetical protein
MVEFVDVTVARVPHGFDFCDPLRLLFGWVQDQGYVVTGHDGERYGSLSSDDRRGTQIELRGYTPSRPRRTCAVRCDARLRPTHLRLGDLAHAVVTDLASVPGLAHP